MAAYRRIIPAGLTGIAVLLLLPACKRFGNTGAELPLPPATTGRATLHAVQSRHLRTVMGQLRGLTFERLPQELNHANQERARLEEASSIASALAQGADRIQGTVEEIRLSQDAREVFLKLADRLREGALKLSSQASQEQTHLVDSTMKEIRATCVDCHNLFRSPIGAPRNRFRYPTGPF